MDTFKNANISFKKMVDKITEDGNHFARYDGDVYKVSVCVLSDKSWTYMSFGYQNNTPMYTPEIFLREDDKDIPLGIAIQTPATSSVSPSEITKVIEMLQYAIDAAAVIQHGFIDAIRAETFDFPDVISGEALE